jgi:1-acyl-sn-glycerol-3-phosphate acyltransferase
MSIGGLFLTTVLLTVLLPLWLPVTLVADVVRGRRRVPMARLLGFGFCYAWVESVAVMRTCWLWITGRGSNVAANYELMGWWAGILMRSLRATTGIAPQIEGLDAIERGNAIMLSRHASLADSLVSGWVTRTVAGVQPRYVLKRELLFDPCLDIVGLRTPNHFIDRAAVDGDLELDALRDLASGVGPGVISVIFAEGTRANDRKRARALEKIAERDPQRAEKLGGLRRLLPPRPAGSTALIEGAPGADVVLAWHTGFDGLDTFGGMISKLSKPLPPVRFVMRRVPRSEVPEGDGFAAWLDDQWLRMDAEVDEALTAGV